MHLHGTEMMKLSELVENKKTAAIAGHQHPDGDCIGSCLALAQYLEKIAPELQVTVYLEEMPDIYAFLSGSDSVKFRYDPETDGPPDVFFALDCGDIKRVAVAEEAFHAAKLRVCIDHHISNKGYGDINHILPYASSTSEILYDLFEEDGGGITKGIAEGLYLGIIQDTGVFQYSSTGEHTMQIAGKLMSFGIDFSRIVEETFFQRTDLQNRILGRVLLDSELHLNGRLLCSVLTLDTIREYGVALSDLEGIVSQLRNTKGVEVAAFFYEFEPGKYKVSLRSKKEVDVSKIALSLGGGGHRCAAASVIEGSARDVLEEIKRQVCAQMHLN